MWVRCRALQKEQDVLGMLARPLQLNSLGKKKKKKKERKKGWPRFGMPAAGISSYLQVDEVDVELEVTTELED